jgi:SAM-dependent methyltransferase
MNQTPMDLRGESREREIARCLETLRANPADLDAHNTLERLKAPQSFGKWMHVNCVIDPADDIFRFFVNHPSSKHPLRDYLSDGWRTLSELMVVLERLDKPLLKMCSVLEFASGFGRFTRHLAFVLGDKVTCADVLPGSMAFAEREFGVKTLPSSHDPATIKLGGGYDLVFVLSMFTHLPPPIWAQWLKALYAGLAPGGVLILSVANEHRAQAEGVSFGEDGTLFIRSSESPSLDADVYGTTYTTRAFVESVIADCALPAGTERAFFDCAFWEGQDAVAIIRP